MEKKKNLAEIEKCMNKNMRDKQFCIRMLLNKFKISYLPLILFWIISIPALSQSQIIQIKEIFTIGTDEKELFYSIKDICIADDSTFYVADSKGFSVSKYNKDGTLIKRIGQRGQGPGEFSMEPFTVILVEDTLYVADGLGKIQLFNTKLEYLINLPGLLLRDRHKIT